MAASAPRHNPTLFLNRELSWLEFNQRVLDEALNRANPLLERVKFFGITSTNLDEFFEVRVAGLKQQVEGGTGETGGDGLGPAETLRAVEARVRRMADDLYGCWRGQLVPELARQGIRFRRHAELDEAARRWLATHYEATIHPVLTPLSIDESHPFPDLQNKALHLAVDLEVTRFGVREERLAFVHVPPNLPRLVRLPGGAGRDYVFLGQVIGAHLGRLFPGALIRGWWAVRVTRNGELYIDEEEVANLLKAVENELQNRRRGAAVRLEVEAGCPEPVRARLLEWLSLTPADLYVVDGPLHPARIMMIADGEHPAALKDPPYTAPVTASLAGRDDLFAAVRERDHLLHHPFESFEPVIAFLQQAATDPTVLAIKQTLYRTGGDPRIVGALMEAARQGKQVTAVVELMARFDEHNNIQWARRLEEAGVHVVYGLRGYKIHAKMTLVVRAEPDGIRRYLHLGTGNYNATTARLYTDVSLLTCRPDFGEDATTLFNLLTGACQFQGLRKFIVAPFELHSQMLFFIRRETENARRGLPARITAKMNSLVDPEIITALYAASQAGVEVDLIVRGTCCLRPGLKGVSERIRVRSIVDRFLEHSRIFHFENACQPQVFVGSADWMPRNFHRRIETVFPIEDGNLRERLLGEVLAANLRDNTRARVLQPDGSYRLLRPPKDGPAHRSQTELMRAASGADGPRSPRGDVRPRMELRPPPPR
ncbi:MAG: polyphosphate kinase 1 [Limisphaerales bacterium]